MIYIRTEDLAKSNDDIREFIFNSLTGGNQLNIKYFE